jgi:hypothetical protein
MRLRRASLKVISTYQETSMTASPLSSARALAEGAREKFTIAKAAFHRAENTHKIALGAATQERIQSRLGPWGGPPRRHVPPGEKAPPTALESVAAEAKKKAEAAELQFNSAQMALSSAEAALLTIENEILNRWRDNKAFEIRKALNAGDPRREAEVMLAELKVLCPPDACVRRHQQFKLSLQVRELLDDHPEAMRVNTPINILRGEGHVDYEARRAEILEESEAAFNNASREVA